MATTSTSPRTHHGSFLLQRVSELGARFAARAAAADRAGQFVADNYADLARHRIISAGVPAELGGGGAGHAELCQLIRVLGRFCGSTALAVSMHTHLVAAAVWKYRQGKPVEPLLRKVASEELVLVSTGASDWLGSNGTLVQVEGGFRYTARKICCSGAPVGNLLVTSGYLEAGTSGPEVLHFAVPIDAEGVTIHEDWDAMGMRATGSHTVTLEDVFIPDAGIALRRPATGWHPAWSVVLTVALPLIMSAYVGVTEAACDIARELAGRRKGDRPYAALGEMETRLESARVSLDSLIANANDYDFTPELERANAALVRKTLTARACLGAVDAAMEAGGGATFARATGFERHYRDVQGCRFHPLAESKQVVFTGRHVLGESPIGN